MIISNSKTGFIIKKGQVNVVIGETIQVGDIIISGPGEFDIAEIEIKSRIVGIYNLYIEGISIIYINKLDVLPTDKELEASSAADVIIASVGDNVDPKLLAKFTSQAEPSYIVLGDSGKLTDFCKSEGGCPNPVDKLTISKKDLTDSKQSIVVLQ